MMGKCIRQTWVKIRKISSLTDHEKQDGKNLQSVLHEIGFLKMSDVILSGFWYFSKTFASLITQVYVQYSNQKFK